MLNLVSYSIGCKRFLATTPRKKVNVVALDSNDLHYLERSKKSQAGDIF